MDAYLIELTLLKNTIHIEKRSIVKNLILVTYEAFNNQYQVK